MRKGFFRYLPDEPFRFKKIFNYLLQGLLIIAPVAVTIYSIYWIVSTVDNWLPIFREPVKDATGTIIRYRVKNYGFITDEEMQKFDMGAEMVAIYVPQAYNWAGQLYVLPRHKIRKIERISPGDSMKYAVTGGVVDTEEEEKK